MMTKTEIINKILQITKKYKIGRLYAMDIYSLEKLYKNCCKNNKGEEVKL